VKTTHEVVLQSLIRGRWLAPHEVEMQLKLHGIHISPTAVTSRMRDVKKSQYGAHPLVKRIRPGTTYYEYTIPTNQQQEA
jgi:hypothetical protein